MIPYNDNQMEKNKNMENAMKTGGIYGFVIKKPYCQHYLMGRLGGVQHS